MAICPRVRAVSGVGIALGRAINFNLTRVATETGTLPRHASSDRAQPLHGPRKPPTARAGYPQPHCGQGRYYGP